MAEKLGDLISRDLVTVRRSDPITDAAKAMRQSDVGNVVVLDDQDNAYGILTDRDIVVRALAEEQDPTQTTAGEICTTDLVALSPDDPIDKAVDTMREQSIRRIIVTEGQRPVGVISIGDLAIDRDSSSALADISAAGGNT